MVCNCKKTKCATNQCSCKKFDKVCVDECGCLSCENSAACTKDRNSYQSSESDSEQGLTLNELAFTLTRKSNKNALFIPDFAYFCKINLLLLKGGGWDSASWPHSGRPNCRSRSCSDSQEPVLSTLPGRAQVSSQSGNTRKLQCNFKFGKPIQGLDYKELFKWRQKSGLHTSSPCHR